MSAFGRNQVCLGQYSVFRDQKGLLRRWHLLSVMVIVLIAPSYEVFASQQTESLNKGWRAQPSFFERKAEGWHWYREQVSEDRKQESEAPDQRKMVSPTQQIEAQRKNLEKKLHAAIVEPTNKNIIAYITAQKTLMDQSQRFAEMWQHVVMTHPSLDETLIHPVDQNARHIYYAEQNGRLEKRIKQLASEYGLFFFFRKNCTYCHHFAPIVKRFAQTHGWSVLPISLDGGALPEFPKPKQNNGIAERLQITHVPALIALHPKTGQLIPLAYGLISESEIEQRVELLTKPINNSLGENK